MRRQLQAARRPLSLPEGWVGKALLAIALVFLLKAAEPFLVPVAVALVLTFVLAAPVRALRRHGLPEALGATLVVGALLAGVVGVGATLYTPALQWLERAPQTLEQVLSRVDRLREAVPALHTTRPVPSADSTGAAATPREALEDKLASKGLDLTGVVLRNALSFSLQAAATLILLFCLLASEHWMVARTVQAIARRRTRALVLSGVRAAQQEIGHFLGVLALVNLGVAIAMSLAMQLIGLPDPVLWGAVAGVVNFIPYLGPVVITALLLLAGASHFHDWGPMLLPAACFLAIHAFEANLVCPLAIGRRLALSPISVFLSVMLWGWLWGVPGAMIAVPVLVGVRSVARRNRRWRWLGLYLESHRRDALPSLRALLQHPPHAARPFESVATNPDETAAATGADRWPVVHADAGGAGRAKGQPQSSQATPQAPAGATSGSQTPQTPEALQAPLEPQPRQAERPTSATTTSRKCGGEIGLTSTRE